MPAPMSGVEAGGDAIKPSLTARFILHCDLLHMCLLGVGSPSVHLENKTKT